MKKILQLSIALALALAVTNAQATIVPIFSTTLLKTSLEDSFPTGSVVDFTIKSTITDLVYTKDIQSTLAPKEVPAFNFVYTDSFLTTEEEIGLTSNGSGAPVPEPATMLMFGTGIACLLGASLKRKKK